MISLSLGLPLLIAGTFPAVSAHAQSSFPVPYGNTAGDALTRNLRLIAEQPNNVSALLGAGRAALELGDPQAALTFFARAEEVAPRDGRVKAGMAAAFVQMEKVPEAFKFFQDAAALGVPEAEFASDRGLAYDLSGDPRRAQADYMLSLRRFENAEVRRRLALSLAISGERDKALATIDAQLRAQDRAAWRVRSFILALTGDAAEATRSAQAAMPAQAAQLAPFFAALPRLKPADRALAVHFGHFPDDPAALQAASTQTQIASAAPAPSAASPAAESGRNSRRSRTAEPAAANPRRRPGASETRTAQNAESPAATLADRYGTTGRGSVSRRNEPRQSRPTILADASAARPIPAAPGERQQPPAATQQSQAPAATQQPPAATQQFRAPTATQQQQQQAPAVTQQFRVPTATQQQQAPAVTQQFRAPTATQQQQAPAATQQFRPPAATQQQANPASQSTAIVSAPQQQVIATARAPLASPVGQTPVQTPTGTTSLPATPISPLAGASSASPQPADQAGAGIRATEIAPSQLQTQFAGSTAANSAPAVSAPSTSAVEQPAAKPSGLANIAAAIQSLPTESGGAPAATEPAAKAPAKLASNSAAKPAYGPKFETAKAPPAKPAAAEAKKVELAKREVPPKDDKTSAKAEPKGAAAKKEADAKAATGKPEAGSKSASAKKDAASKTAEAKKDEPKGKEPSRHWVQIAGGANEAAMTREFLRLKTKAPKLLSSRTPWTTPLRATNRLLVGPFKSTEEAQDFVNDLAKLGVSAFSWTSPAGQEIVKLAAK